MQKVLLLLVLVPVFGLRLSAQVLNYEIRINEDPIGQMKAVREGSSKSVYRLESLIKYQKMIKLELEYRMEAIFVNKVLQYSSTIQKNNGTEFTNSRTERTGKGYKITTLKSSNEVNIAAIGWNLSRLYFTEPVGVKQIWSDAFGQMLEIKPAGVHRFELVLPDGKSSFYSYFKGICVLVETEMLFGKISFQLRK